MIKPPRLCHQFMPRPITLALVVVMAGVLLAAVCGKLYQHYTTVAVEKLLRDGRTAFSRGDDSMSVHYAERALLLSPNEIPAWKLLAESAGHAGQIDRSLEALERYGQLKPTDAGKLGLRLGIFWMKQNRTQPAIQALRLAERLNVNATEAGVNV